MFNAPNTNGMMQNHYLRAGSISISIERARYLEQVSCGFTSSHPLPLNCSHRWKRPDLLRQFRRCSMNHEQYARGQRSMCVRVRSALVSSWPSSREHHQWSIRHDMKCTTGFFECVNVNEYISCSLRIILNRRCRSVQSSPVQFSWVQFNWVGLSRVESIYLSTQLRYMKSS